MLKNSVNCWEALRAEDATTQPVMAIVTAQKVFGLGDQQPSRLKTIGGRFNDQSIARTCQAAGKRGAFERMKIWSDLYGNIQQGGQAQNCMVSFGTTHHKGGDDTMKVSLELVERFHEKWVLNKETGCWEWIASLAGRGYGQIKCPGERQNIYAHRLSWRIHFGEIPEGMYVCHACDNPKCVRPSHLFLGTSEDNHRDMKAKDRHLRGSRNAVAKLTEEKVRQIHRLAQQGVSQGSIAKAFKVRQSTIWKILHGLRWEHVYREIKNPDGK